MIPDESSGRRVGSKARPIASPAGSAPGNGDRDRSGTADASASVSAVDTLTPPAIAIATTSPSTHNLNPLITLPDTGAQNPAFPTYLQTGAPSLAIRPRKRNYADVAGNAYGPGLKHVDSVPPMQTHSSGSPRGPLTMTTRPVQAGPGVVQRAIRGTASNTANATRNARIQATRFMPSRPRCPSALSALASPFARPSCRRRRFG